MNKMLQIFLFFILFISIVFIIGIGAHGIIDFRPDAPKSLITIE